METRPTERLEQTIAEMALAVLPNPGVGRVEILDNHDVCVVNAVVNKVHGHGLEISVPFPYITMRLWGKRIHLHRRFDGNMSKDGLIFAMMFAIKETRRTADERDLHSLMPYPDQILWVRIRCDRGQKKNCASVMFDKHIKGSIWFDVIKEPVAISAWGDTLGDRWYEAQVQVRPFAGSILFKRWFNERLNSPSLARLPGDVWDHTARFLGLPNPNPETHSRRTSDPPGWTRQTKRKILSHYNHDLDAEQRLDSYGPTAKINQ